MARRSIDTTTFQKNFDVVVVLVGVSRV